MPLRSSAMVKMSMIGTKLEKFILEPIKPLAHPIVWLHQFVNSASLPKRTNSAGPPDSATYPPVCGRLSKFDVASTLAHLLLKHHSPPPPKPPHLARFPLSGRFAFPVRTSGTCFLSLTSSSPQWQATPTKCLQSKTVRVLMIRTFVNICYRVKLDPMSASGGRGIKRMLSSGGGSSSAPEERVILNGVTGKVCPGELLAVLGPSGSGKSTLLSILAGRLQGKHSGDVLANGRRLEKSFLRRTGFVTQDDVLYPHLTVRETLVFCAMLRLPRTVAREEKVAAAEAVMTELGLCKCADTVVGGPFVRGISGGERKRVSIGHEMLVNPSLLLLDEPTSGLDSTAASRLVATLGGLARKGRTVVTSIHQPASRVYQMFDSVLLLSEGSCLYLGKAKDAMDYFGSIGFAPKFHVNPADFMLDLANGFIQTEYQGDPEKSNVKQLLISSYNRVLAPKVNEGLPSATKDATLIGRDTSVGREKKDKSSISWFSQFSILLRRSLKERRHESFNSLRVFQVMATAVLSGSMWWHSSIRDVQDRLGLLFFITIFWGVFASFNSVFTFPQERAIFIKERSSGMYSLSSYFMARMAGDLPMELILPAVFTLILYWMAGLRTEPGAFLLTLAVLLGYVLVAQGLGLALGAAIMDAKQASTVSTITMLAFLLTGGFYVEHIPSCLNWLKYLSFTFYGYRLLINIQYRGNEMEHFLGLSHGRRTKGSQGGHVEHVDSSMCIAALITMLVGYRLLAYIALRRTKLR
ncbi:ABC transporter G family member 25-like isoform X1 [Canna indica]|uniref:ABC transporter G family member 25-like isoform X1 n=1 Tax=Canna indica TaxID=4628 RepID=A0AAQ3KQL4_9LILI|nr:ABC transporter G family member 25-like isoform X1 [Canna indica]